jgi:hypothetical protein
MRLKLIETNATPKMGDLIRFPSGRLHVATQDGITNKGYVHGTKVVKPYGISDEEVTEVGCSIYVDNKIETVISIDEINSIVEVRESDTCYAKWYIKKVNILPEQFNYQDIVDLELKDGDEFKAEPLYSLGYPMELSYRITPVYNYEDLTSTEVKPTPVTYTEEEVKAYCLKAFTYYYGVDVMQQDSSVVLMRESFEKWFNLNKKKQPFNLN